MSRGVLPAALSAIAALALCGCGGDSLSMSQLRSDATRICAASTQRTNRIAAPTSVSGAGAFLRQGAAAIGVEQQQLRALKPANDVAQVYSTALDASAAELGALRRTAGELARSDDSPSTIKSLQNRLGPIESRANAAWRSLAIPACVNR